MAKTHFENYFPNKNLEKNFQIMFEKCFSNTGICAKVQRQHKTKVKASVLKRTLEAVLKT